MWIGTRPVCCEKIKLDSIAIDEKLAANTTACSTVSNSTSFFFSSMEVWNGDIEDWWSSAQICTKLLELNLVLKLAIWLQSVIFSSFPMFLLVTIELPFVNLFSTRSNSSSSFNFWRKTFFQVFQVPLYCAQQRCFFPWWNVPNCRPQQLKGNILSHTPLSKKRFANFVGKTKFVNWEIWAHLQHSS